MSKRNKKRYSGFNLNQNQSRGTLVDIVIPVFNAFEFLEKCLNSIPASVSSSYSVWCIDNGSDQEKATRFYQTRDDIRYEMLRENKGFAYACNRGASKGNSPYIFFLNSDIVLFPNSVDKLVESFNDPIVGIAGMKLIFPENSPNGPAGTIQHVGLGVNIHGDFHHQFIGWKPDNVKVMRVDTVPAVTGAALMIRRSLFSRIGGFDTVYGIGTWEDIDLCMKCLSSGFEVVVAQQAMGYHYTGATAIANKIKYPIEQNRMLFMNRWLGKYPWTDWQYY